MLGYVNQIFQTPSPLLRVGQVENEPTEVKGIFVEVVEELCYVDAILSILLRPGIGNQLSVHELND